jgi:hypothetical protein
VTARVTIRDPADLLEEMFPGDPVRGLPPFSALGRGALEKLDTEASALVPYLRDHAEIIDSIPEVNEALVALRKLAYQPVQDFIFAALNTYFAAPAVVSVLRGGPVLLFPNARVLPDIDYDLLTPVLALTYNREPK